MSDIDILKKAIAKKHPCDPSHKALGRVTQALQDAVWAAGYLSEQQAMPDDGYKARLESARAVLANHAIAPSETHEHFKP